MIDSLPVDPVRVLVVKSWGEFSEFRSAYLELIENKNEYCSLTFHPDWMERMLDLYLRDGIGLNFFLVFRGSKLLGIAPFLLEKKGLLAGGLRRLFIWGGYRGALNNVNGDFVYEDGEMQTTIGAVEKFLNTDYRAMWDYLEIPYFSESSPSFQLFRELYKPSRVTRELDGYHIRWFEPNSDVLNAMTSRARREIYRQERRFREDYPRASFNFHAKLSDAQLAEIAGLHTGRQSELEAVRGLVRERVFENKETRPVVFDLIRIAEERGWLHCYTVEVGGEIVSFQIDFLYRGVLRYFLTGFDSRFSRYSLPRQLLTYSINSEAYRFEPCIFDFLPGVTSIKQDFANEVQRNWKVSLVNRSLVSSRVRVACWELAVWVSRRLRRLLAPS